MTDEEFEIGDKIQYCSGNPLGPHPIGTIVGLVRRIDNRYQKVIIQFGNEKPRQVYANDYKIVEKGKKDDQT